MKRSSELEKLLSQMLEIQDYRCTLSGFQFAFPGPNSDKNLLPSADRIDSNGHYEPDNIQLVCRFINFSKGSSENQEFKRLLLLVRGLEEIDDE